MVPRKITLIVLAAVAPGVLPLVPTGAAACATNHIRILLTGFPPEGATRALYFAPESAGSTNFTILAGGDACDEPARVNYGPTGGTAGPSDYTLNSGTVNFFLPAHQSDDEPIPVGIVNDSATEPFIESIQVGLSSPWNASLGAPATAPILIIDDEGMTRAGFEGPQHTQSESVAGLRIPVFQAGSPPAAVNFSIAPDPASAATPGEDFQGPVTGTLTFSSDDRVGTIDLTVVNDTVAEAEESFIISLSGPVAAGAGQMRVTIQDNEESELPTSRIHHPRHKWRYKKSDYRIREVHVFTHDNPGGAGVTAAQFALRRNLKNGDCQWLSQSGWKQGDCQNREWLPTTYDSVGELWRYRPKQLKSSVGTRIKNYTAFSRAIDGAGNVEKEFDEKRNANTFEVKRSKRGRR
jgi:Calx-beta domain